jgi:hypothetical protein
MSSKHCSHCIILIVTFLAGLCFSCQLAALQDHHFRVLCRHKRSHSAAFVDNSPNKAPTGQLCHVFISYAGEQRQVFVDYLQQAFQIHHPLLRVLLQDSIADATDAFWEARTAIEDAFSGKLQ